jgi:DNA mismatch endonuclease (patch repair protein)
MQGNRRRDTKPEMRVRRAVHALGLRYRVDVRPLPDLNRRADLVFTRAKVAVFVDGCFWHGCPEHGTTAKKNASYWGAKIKRNRERDAETDRILSLAGWRTIRIWEHDDAHEAARKVAEEIAWGTSDRCGGSGSRQVSTKLIVSTASASKVGSGNLADSEDGRACG